MKPLQNMYTKDAPFHVVDRHKNLMFLNIYKNSSNNNFIT